jgi:acetyltransferase
MSVRKLEALFAPASVAVIGVSERPGKLGTIVLRNLQLGGFKGPLWPVNKHLRSVAGQPAWLDVASLPGVPDLAMQLQSR